MATAESPETPEAPTAPTATQVAEVTFVGVDLGSQNAVVASSKASEPTSVSVATNDLANRATPVVVAFDGKERAVGEAAEGKFGMVPKMTVTYITSALGDPETLQKKREKLGCMWSASEAGLVGPLTFGGREDLELKPFSAIVALLKKLKSFAVPDKETPAPFEVALSVPDSWGPAEIDGIASAVTILGWDAPATVHLVPHSCSLVTAYVQKVQAELVQEPRTVLFIDMGYCQTCAFVASLAAPPEEDQTGPVVKMLASASDGDLGVHSLLCVLWDHLSEIVKQKHNDEVKFCSKKGVRALTALQKGLKELSMLPDTSVILEAFLSDEGDVKLDLSRDLLETLAKSVFDRLGALADKALADAGVARADVHSVELVGGGGRIPKVQKLLSDLFPDDSEGEAKAKLSSRLRFGLDGSSAVAVGATLYAAGRRAVSGEIEWPQQITATQDLETYRSLEEWMASTNDGELKKLAKGNDLEAYVYEVRSWLNGKDKNLLNSSVIEPLLDETILWYEDRQYEEDTTFEMYDERLTGLKRKLEEHCSDFFEKKRKDKEDLEASLAKAAEEERQRRHELGMDADKDDRKMSKSERLRMAAKNKDEGNEVFKAGNLEDAVARYTRALQHLKKFDLLDAGPDEKAEGDKIALSVQLNLAQTYLKMAALVEKTDKNKAEGVYKKAEASCSEALKIDPESIKAKFRKATCLEKLGDIDGAAKEVKAALVIEPENADLLKLKERLEKLQAIQKQKAKKMYGKMFG
eukprot:TRINITY_DN106332_c0_g1_i1.p1 TRINITY_DN106332_c0_g1~~TRINITY_DN106332_c0_g1_i1.p1  ORF type:complete len:781 (-),score=190.74 TRINITY_DN106332_c0_g1_i1:58-2313(-)